MGCIRHVDVPGQQSMATMGGCASFSRALGVSQILVLDVNCWDVRDEHCCD